MKKNWLAALIIFPALVTTACNEAWANDRFDEGYALGLRNGNIIANRLKERTVNTHGCAAMNRFQNGLLAVTRNVRPPANTEGLAAQGFFTGYIDAIRNELETARTDCNDRSFSDGSFAGTFFGSVFCQVASADALEGFNAAFLWEDWSGGSNEVVSECLATAAMTLQNCGLEPVGALSLNLEKSCSDVTTAVAFEE